MYARVWPVDPLPPAALLLDGRLAFGLLFLGFVDRLPVLLVLFFWVMRRDETR
jgi:hypothetical protein